MIQKARKKPVIIEYVQWTGDNDKEIIDFFPDAYFHRYVNTSDLSFKELISWELYIYTLEGDHQAGIGDYIIKGVHGEFYPCKEDIFHKTYEVVE